MKRSDFLRDAFCVWGVRCEREDARALKRRRRRSSRCGPAACWLKKKKKKKKKVASLVAVSSRAGAPFSLPSFACEQRQVRVWVCE